MENWKIGPRSCYKILKTYSNLGPAMKMLFVLSALVLSSNSFARLCGPSGFASICEVAVESTTTSECHILRSGNMFPETYKPRYHVHPWHRESLETIAASCDGDLQACKDFAFRELEKFSYTNSCGDVSVGKSVDFRFQTLNTDGTVESQINGRFKK